MVVTFPEWVWLITDKNLGQSYQEIKSSNISIRFHLGLDLSKFIILIKVSYSYENMCPLFTNMTD